MSITESNIFQYEQVVYNSNEIGLSNTIEQVNSYAIFEVALTNLRKYVQYNVQVLAYTRLGDGKLSEPVVSVRTFEDGKRKTDLHVLSYI